MIDLTIAAKYIAKADMSRGKGIPFDLPWQSFNNLMNAKYCKFTGIELTDKKPGNGIKSTDRTIDRIDNSKGYVIGNVAAVCNVANQFKSMLEDPQYIITPKLAIQIASVMFKE